jgi:hypothetical protein
MESGWGEVSSWFRYGLHFLPNKLVLEPLRVLYFQGPQLWGIGGWAGMAPEDICSQMTSVPAMTWRAFRMDDCHALLDARFTSVAVTVWSALYLFAAYKIISLLWFRYFILGPVLAEIRSAFRLKTIQN